MLGKKKKLPALDFDINQIEAIRDTGTSIAKGVGDELKKAAHLAWEQSLGLGTFSTKQSGEMQQGEEIVLRKKQEEQEKKAKFANIDAGINYTAEIIHAERRVTQETNREVKTTVQEILLELKRIKGMSKEIESQFRDVDTINMPEAPGKYHINFFEWVLSVVRNARMKIEDSKAWLTSVRGKSARKQHWTTNKNQGTQFGLSAERSSATQVG
jgi:hypothetical protein